MKPNSHEQSKRHTFDSFCKKVLKHEARDYYDELKRQRDREVSFSDLSEKELAQLYTEDKYFVSEQIFNVLGLNVIVTDDVIAEALQSLPERKRDIILLSYFLELSDREIGDKLNMLRSTVQYQRTSTLQQLKNFMKGAIQDLVEQMQENLATASQQSDDIMDKTDELHKIEAKLSGEDVSEKVRAINNEIQICVKTINKCNNDRDKLNRERGGLEKERERADTERQNLTLLDEKNRKTQMYLTYARKIYEELENVYRTSEEEIRNRLQDTINDIFKQIYEGGLSLTIDSKYHITVQANDYEGDVETSTAQSISVIFAFITGIIKMARENRNASDDDAKLLSSEPYPLVMDAPLSAFDKRRIKTVCEALPETAEQVIIFIKDTDGELAEDYMGNRIGSRHQFDKKNEFETNLV